MNQCFDYALAEDGIHLTLLQKEKRWFRQNKLTHLPVQAWLDEQTAATRNAIRKIELALNEQSTEVKPLDGQAGYWLSDRFVASLTESQAQALQLPPIVPFQLNLGFNGPLMKDQTKIIAQWHAASGRVLSAEQNGALLRLGGENFRLPYQTFALLNAVQAYNTSQGDNKTASCAEISQQLSQITGEAVKADSRLTSLRLVHASSLSLDVSTSANGIAFDPVLFNKHAVETARSYGQVLEASAQLLTPQHQRQFAQHFKHQASHKAYALEKNHYVFIDPELRPALEVIKEAQSWPAEQRREFIKSPASAIKQRLQDLSEQGGTTYGSLSEEAIDALTEQLFVETDSFSARVKDIGVWQPPVLPFIEKQSNQWLPEGYLLQLKDKTYHIEKTELDELKTHAKAAQARGEPEVTLNNGQCLPIDAHSVAKLHALSDADLVNLDGDEPAQEAFTPALEEPPMPKQRMALETEENTESLNFTAQREQNTRLPALNGFERPEGLINEPKRHQEDGIAWLQAAWNHHYSGVLLADDMGLGKTFQTLAFLTWLQEKRQTLGLEHKPVLLVAPTSLLGTWQQEATIHLSESARADIKLLYGNGAIAHYRKPPFKKNDVVTGQPTLDTDRLKSAQWILTSYATMRDYHISLAKLPFAAVVFDEMQNIKNITSMQTQAAKSLNAEFSLGLTGTPVENSLADLWTLFDTLMPGKLGIMKDFVEHYEKASENQAERLKQLHDQLTLPQDKQPAMMLRRLKDDIAKDLPKKEIISLEREMPKRQAIAYQEALTEGKQAIGSNGARRAKLAAFQAIRKISLHPESPSDGYDLDDYIGQSARLSLLFELLDEAAKARNKVLIFIESIEVHEWLSGAIKERYAMRHYPNRIFGSVSAERRTKIVEQFQHPDNTGFDALLLSPKAAGVGLTLTAANTVIHLSRWWNPAVEDQCTDRAYRIGQTQDVSVFLLKAKHPVYGNKSFDFVLDDLLSRKRALSKGTLMPVEDGSELDSMMNALTQSD